MAVRGWSPARGRPVVTGLAAFKQVLLAGVEHGFDAYSGQTSFGVKGIFGPERSEFASLHERAALGRVPVRKQRYDRCIHC